MEMPLLNQLSARENCAAMAPFKHVTASARRNKGIGSASGRISNAPISSVSD